ncbi:MAG: HD domain-containing protein [Clostridium sp.]
MNTRLKQQIEFLVEVDKIKGIIRQNLLADGSRRENDAEHSWHLSLMSTILLEHAPENIDILKVIKMVIIHDLVEIDAGDTYAYDSKGYESKKERELLAANRIFNLLPKDQADEIFSLWNEFEDEITLEATFAACIDRLQPFILNYYSGGISWVKHEVTKTQVMKRMSIIEKTSPNLWEVFMTILKDAIAKGYIKE